MADDLDGKSKRDARSGSATFYLYIQIFTPLMSTTYLPCDNTLADCDPSVLVTQMQEERGKFSHDISQEIQEHSRILKFGEKCKRPFPSGMGDFVKSMVLDIAHPSARDVLDHQKRLASAAPGNSPCDVPSRIIPYGSHTVESCLFSWAWETDWFCKTDLAFKYKREQQIQQIKDIMTTWSLGIWDKWFWRSYQRSVQNYVLAQTFPEQHGALGYSLTDPTAKLSIAWLDIITLRMADASGLRGSPFKGSWCIFIGEEEAKDLFDDYYRSGASNYGVRQVMDVRNAMASHKRYDERWDMEYYELNNYKFFVETRAPRYRERTGTESWDDALLDDVIQVDSLYGTESQVPRGYRDPDTAKFAEILIFNEEAVVWNTPPIGMTENNGFHQDRVPGYSYAGDFIPVSPPQVEDPLGKKVKYHAQFVAGMESRFPKRGAAILAQAAHMNPDDYTLTLNISTEIKVAVREAVPSLPQGNVQISTVKALPNAGAGYELFLRSAGEHVVKISNATSDYCESTGVWIHNLEFANDDAKTCVPRSCDQWKEVVVLAADTDDTVLTDESGCAYCGGKTPEGELPEDIPTVIYTGDNIQGIVTGATYTEGTVAATLETAVQAVLDGGDGGTITIDETDDVWTITIEGGPDSFQVYYQDEGGGLEYASSDPEGAAPESVGDPETVFTVADNESDAGFAAYAGAYYDSGENDGSGNPIWTNGTEFAANGNDLWDDAAMEFYTSLAHAQAGSNKVYESVSAGVSQVVTQGTSTVRGVQS